MPFPPSLGLSDLIHLSVIIWNKIKRVLGMKNCKFKKYKTSPLKKMISGVVVVAITIIIISGASSIVYISATEKHSTLHFALNMYRKIRVVMDRDRIPKLAINTAQTKNNIKICTDTDSSNPDKLAQDFENISTNTDSIIDYLKDNNQDDSFDNRQLLAEQNGIENYEGDIDQNYILLRTIIKNKELEAQTRLGACNLSESMSILETQTKN